MSKKTKRRHTRKVFGSNAKTDSVIVAIIEDLEAGKMNRKEIANTYGVSIGTVMTAENKIRLGYTNGQFTKEEEPIEAKSVDFEKLEQIAEEEKEVKESDKEINEKSTVVEEGEIDLRNENIEGTKEGIRGKLSDDAILKVTTELESVLKTGLLPTPACTAVGEKLNVNPTTVLKYGREFGLLPARKKREPKGKGTVKKKVEPVKSVTYHRREVLHVGMIKDRHDLPVFITKYIFERSLGQASLFDYDTMDETVTKFIKSNIPKRDKDLAVYVTGLSAVLASIIKICNKLKINLTIYHYNTSTGEYVPQTIWDQFEKKSTMYPAIINSFSSTTLVNCTFESIDPSLLYSVKIVNFSAEDKNNRDVDLYLYNDEAEMWKHYATLLQSVMLDKTHNKSIYAETAEIRAGGLIFKQRISQSSNFTSIFNSK